MVSLEMELPTPAHTSLLDSPSQLRQPPGLCTGKEYMSLQPEAPSWLTDPGNFEFHFQGTG